MDISQVSPLTQGSPLAPKARLYRAPLLSVAVAMMLGITAGRYLPLPVGLYGVVAAAALIVALVCVRRAHLRMAASGAVLAAVWGMAAVHGHLSYFAVDQDDIVTYTQNAGTLATIRGQIVSSPMLVEDAPGTVGYHRPPRTCFVLQTSQVRLNAEAAATSSQPASSPTPPAGSSSPSSPAPTAPPIWQHATGLVRVTVGEQAALWAGQDVELAGWLGRVRPADNPGQSDWAQQARSDHSMVWMTVPAADGVTALDSGRPWYARVFWHVWSAARQHLSQTGDREDGRLLDALITGERHKSLATLNRMMMQAGTAHFLSISGQHLVIFLGMLYLLCRVASLRPRAAAGIVLVVLTAYMLLAEPNAPLLRSAIMAGAVCLATLMDRQYAALNAISAAAIILLVLDPLQLFSAGFQLSFAIVAGMIVLHRPIRQMLFGRWLKRRGLIVFRREHRLRRWLYFGVANWAIMAATVSLSAYAVSAPLVAYHFGLFSPYAGVLSLALEPLVAAVLVPAYVSVALAWPMPNLSAWVGQLAAHSADALTWSVQAATHLPGLCFSMRPVSVIWVLACYAGLAVIVLHGRLPRGRLIATATVLCLVGFTVWTQLAAAPPAGAQLNVLAVGDGQCVVLRTPAGQTYLFDAGTRSGLDVYDQVLLPFLRQQRLPSPRIAFVSHANTDHYNALPALMKQSPLRCVYLNDYFAASEHLQVSPDEAIDPRKAGDLAGAEMVRQLRAERVNVVALRVGDRIELDDRTSVEVLWPQGPPPGTGAATTTTTAPAGAAAARASAKAELAVNDTSLVLRITCDGKSILVPGDIDQAGQRALMSLNHSLHADVLVMPHHGSFKPSLPAFVEAIHPGIVVASSSIEHHMPATKADLAKDFYTKLHKQSAYYSTARNGWVQVQLGPGKIEVRTMR